MKLLMHVCCAPCSVFCIEELRKEGIEPTLYWYNPNIHPYTEYKLRRDSLIEYAEKINVKLIIEDEYGMKEFCKEVVKDLKSRCVNYCYPLRLRKTFQYAKENGYDAVTTSLLYSIYQNHKFIKIYSEKLSNEFNVKFLYRDFRKGFWEGHNKAIEENIYMQKYCGCIFSIDEALEENRDMSKIQLPEGFEWKNKRSFKIKKLKDDSEILDSKFDVSQRRYENDLTYVLQFNNEDVSIAILKEYNKNIIELLYIETVEDKRKKGYASRLIKMLSGNYKQKYNKMIIGTDAEIIPFFVKNNFVEFHGIKNEKNYYIKKLNER